MDFVHYRGVLVLYTTWGYWAFYCISVLVLYNIWVVVRRRVWILYTTGGYWFCTLPEGTGLFTVTGYWFLQNLDTALVLYLSTDFIVYQGTGGKGHRIRIVPVDWFCIVPGYWVLYRTWVLGIVQNVNLYLGNGSAETVSHLHTGTSRGGGPYSTWVLVLRELCPISIQVHQGERVPIVPGYWFCGNCSPSPYISIMGRGSL